MNPVD